MIEGQFLDAIVVFERFESTVGLADKEYIRTTRNSTVNLA